MNPDHVLSVFEGLSALASEGFLQIPPEETKDEISIAVGDSTAKLGIGRVCCDMDDRLYLTHLGGATTEIQIETLKHTVVATHKRWPKNDLIARLLIQDTLTSRSRHCSIARLLVEVARAIPDDITFLEENDAIRYTYLIRMNKAA